MLLRLSALWWRFFAVTCLSPGPGSSAPGPGGAPPPPPPLSVDKHASELDLGCTTYDDGVDWLSVRRQILSFIRNPTTNHPSVDGLLRLARKQPKSDCYIGLCSLCYLALLFMPAPKRSAALRGTLFGSVPLHDQIPLAYWDTIWSGWPIFGLLDLVGGQVRSDALPPPPSASDGCCDRITSELDRGFKLLLEQHLAAGLPLPLGACLRYLEASPQHCSWGKACAYFAMAERLLHAKTPGMKQAAREMMALGEAQLDSCAEGRNVTIHEQMLSGWPFWALLRRVETEALVDIPTQMLRTPPDYQAPPVPATPQLPSTPSASSGATGSPHSAAGVEAAPPARAAGAAGSGACSRRDVHVVLAGDRRHVEGVMAVVNSVVSNTYTPKRICIHLFCLEGAEADFYVAALRCSLADRGLRELPGAADEFDLRGTLLRVHTFPAEAVLTPGLTVDQAVLTEAGDLNTPHNFVRFHLARWIPPATAPRVVYFDTDVIVLGDVCELHDSAFLNSSFALTPAAERPVVAAVPRRSLPLSVYLKVTSPKMPLWLPSTTPSFNAGVMVLDLLEWERLGLSDAVSAWAWQNRGRQLWRHGSQPPLLLLLHDRAARLDPAWNVDGLGHNRNLSEMALGGAKILHWTGPLKPWLPGGLHRELWEPYRVHCWGRGSGLSL